MWQSYATGLTAVVLMVVGWVLVQTAWRRAFSRFGSDPDALATRTGCGGGGGCGCAGVCREETDETERRGHHG